MKYIDHPGLKIEIQNNQLDIIEFELNNQPEIIKEHIEITIQWLDKVKFNVRVSEYVLILAIFIMYFVLKRTPIKRKQLQNLAITSFIIANRFFTDSNRLIPMNQVPVITANAYKLEEVTEMEEKIYNTLTANNRNFINKYVKNKTQTTFNTPRGKKHIFSAIKPMKIPYTPTMNHLFAKDNGSRCIHF